MTNQSYDYFDAVSETLKSCSFSKSDEYEDLLGGKVVDFFRDDDRITCVVSARHVQILSYVQGEFAEWVKERLSTHKTDIVGYVTSVVSITSGSTRLK